MNPRQAGRERREAERKAEKLELKKCRLAEKHPLAAVDKFPEIQPGWNPELEDEFPKECKSATTPWRLGLTESRSPHPAFRPRPRWKSIATNTCETKS